jgi:heptosyltransferase-2
MKVCIIKTGYSETADKEIGRISSLGDVLRTTVILHKFKDDDVTWVVDEKAAPLLEKNPFIKRILIWDVAASIQLMNETYDVVINLEKVPGICALASVMKARRKYGFYFDFSTGEPLAYDGAEQVFSIVNSHIGVKKSHGKKWQELLMSVIGEKYNGEEYILAKPLEPHVHTNYSVGLNFRVGSKWPSKAWPSRSWAALKLRLIAKKIYWSEQPEETNLVDYIKWVNSCELIVTNDSLGLHVALALGKKVLLLCGPTNADEIDLYNQGVVLLPEYECYYMPCIDSQCQEERSCMASISIDNVFKRIEAMI